jgi:hypothetical protein
LEAIAIPQGECNTLAVYAFKMRFIRRIFVQQHAIVAEVQLGGLEHQTDRKAARRLARALRSD